MAVATLRRCDLYPVGTLVAAYHRRDNSRGEGSPHGNPATSATVAADGSLTFTGLEEPTWPVGSYVPYAAYAQVDGQHRWLWFRAHRDVPLSANW